MESQDLTQEEKLHVVLCGHLRRTERALRQRGNVEIIRENKDINLLVGISKGMIDCDMMIVQAPYGHGLYGLTYPVRKDESCPVWMVADPPDEVIWKEISLQLDRLPAEKKEARKKAIAAGVPRHEILILADTPERRRDFTCWIREIYAKWNRTPPTLTVPEDAKTYLRELHWPCAPPEAVVIAMAGVDSLNAAEHIRQLYPKAGMVWCCDLDFSTQACHLEADYFFLLGEASIGTLGIGLDRVYQYSKRR